MVLNDTKNMTRKLKFNPHRSIFPFNNFFDLWPAILRCLSEMVCSINGKQCNKGISYPSKNIIFRYFDMIETLYTCITSDPLFISKFILQAIAYFCKIYRCWLPIGNAHVLSLSFFLWWKENYITNLHRNRMPQLSETWRIETLTKFVRVNNVAYIRRTLECHRNAIIRLKQTAWSCHWSPYVRQT